MVHALKDEILRRLEANYSIKNIREDLISKGFSPKKVDKAIEDALKVFAKRVEKGASSAKSNIQRSSSLSIVNLGIIEKIKMVLISPRKLFETIKEEELRKTIEYGLILYSTIFVLSSLFLILFLFSYLSSFGSIGNMLINILSAKNYLIIILFYVFWLFIQLAFMVGFSIGFSILESLYLHLWIKIVRIVSNTWDYTFKAVIYSMTPYLCAIPIAFLFLSLNLHYILLFIVFIIIFFWVIAILSIGISELHNTSFVRSIIAVILSIIIPVVVIFAYLVVIFFAHF